MKNSLRTLLGATFCWSIASLAVAGEPSVSLSGQFEQETGEQLYSSICQGCHMANGEGAQGAGFYPKLAGNPNLAAKSYPIFVLTHGLGGMPNFKDYLSDKQIAEVINYVRTHFGNHYTDAVTVEDVKIQSQR